MSTKPNNNSTSGEFRNWLTHFMKEFQKVYGDNYLQYKRKSILTGKSLGLNEEEQQSDISVKRLQALDKKMDTNIEYYSAKTLLIDEAKVMIDSLRPLYDDLMDLHGKENVLISSLIAIGDIVRSRITSRNQKVKADLMRQMGTENKTDANAEEYDANEKIADDILTTLAEGFADFDEIYQNIKNSGLPGTAESLSQDEALIKNMEDAYKQYDKSLYMLRGIVPIRPIIDDDIDTVIDGLSDPFGDLLMVDVYEYVDKSVQAGGAPVAGAPVAGSTPMHVDGKYSIGKYGYSELDGEEVPEGVQIFLKNGKTPASVMKKLLSHINKN